MQPQNFVIGTGRCGSTLLSTLLAEHPDALVLTEFFGGLDVLDRFAEGDITGGQLAAILARDNELTNLWVNRNFTVKETVLDMSAVAKEHSRIPPLMFVMLPSLSDDPQGLFDEVIQWAKKQPTQPLSRHYPELFGWLMRMFNKTAWIERSGGSLEFFPGMRRTFPKARYVHIHRDGKEAALSMMNYPHFKTIVPQHFHPMDEADCEAAIAMNRSREQDPIYRWFDQPLPAEKYGEYWSFCVAKAFSAIPLLDRDQYMDLQFETLLKKPHDTLRTVARFFDLPDRDEWIDRAVGKIQGDVPLRGPALSPDVIARLDAACKLGQILIGRDIAESPTADVSRRLRAIYNR